MKTNYAIPAVVVVLVLVVAVLFFSLDKDGTHFPYKGRPGQTLSYQEVVSMLYHYDTTREQVLKTALGKEDTRENFYPLDDLKAYIAYIEKLAGEKDIEVTGINIIAAAYPDDKNKYGKKNNYQTIILMPATTINGKERISFDPLYSDKGTPKRFDEILKEYGYLYRKSANSGAENNAAKKMFMLKSNAASVENSTQSSTEDRQSVAANRTQVTPPLESN